MSSIHKRLVSGEPRYDVFFREPDGRQRKRTFRHRVEADRFASTVAADVLRVPTSIPTLDASRSRDTPRNGFARGLLKQVPVNSWNFGSDCTCTRYLVRSCWARTSRQRSKFGFQACRERRQLAE